MKILNIMTRQKKNLTNNNNLFCTYLRNKIISILNTNENTNLTNKKKFVLILRFVLF